MPSFPRALAVSTLVALAFVCSVGIADAGKKARKRKGRKKTETTETTRLRAQKGALKLSRKLVTGVGGTADALGKKLVKRAKKIAAKKGKKSRRARLLKSAGRTIVKLAGTKTLSRTSLSIDLALVLSPHFLEKFGNAHVYAGVLAPSLRMQQKILKKGKKQKFIKVGADVDTAIGGFGVNSWSGRWAGVNLPYVAPWVGEHAWGVNLGLDYVAALGLGRYEDIGSYASFSTGIPLAGIVKLGVAGALYYPPLDPLIEKARPAAEWAQDKQARVFAATGRITSPITSRLKGLKGKLRRSRTKEPDRSDETETSKPRKRKVPSKPEKRKKGKKERKKRETRASAGELASSR
jgi:hypothetical protein